MSEYTLKRQSPWTVDGRVISGRHRHAGRCGCGDVHWENEAAAGVRGGGSNARIAQSGRRATLSGTGIQVYRVWSRLTRFQGPDAWVQRMLGAGRGTLYPPPCACCTTARLARPDRWLLPLSPVLLIHRHSYHPVIHPLSLLTHQKFIQPLSFLSKSCGHRPPR